MRRLPQSRPSTRNGGRRGRTRPAPARARRGEARPARGRRAPRAASRAGAPILRAPLLREAVTVAVEAVATTLPKREVHMAAVARVLGPRLRRQRGDEAMPNRHRANRLPNEQLLVRRLERGRMPGRDLLLAVPEL